MTDTELEKLAINVVRGIAMDAPHKAKSGHQGTAMALAPLAHILWTRIMKYDSAHPNWQDRDRFILSAGHASILLYAFLHLTGFGLSIQDLKDFRQLDSLTPGHPEAGHTAGVEVTTGPLGQGFANGVGMAIAERSLRERFGPEVCDHNIYTICSDGDLAEGLSHEAASLAGHLGLGKLVYVYDDNRISIDGPTDLWLGDDAAMRFKSYGWHVIQLGEQAEDLEAMEKALLKARSQVDAPSLVILQSHVANPSPDLRDNPAAHGYALFDDEIAATKKVMGLPPDETFYIPPEVLDFYRAAGTAGNHERQAWTERFNSHPDYKNILEPQNTSDWKAKLPTYVVGEQIATRKASEKCLNNLLEDFPEIVAGGADLTGNTGTAVSSQPFSTPFSKADATGRQIYFGVREHAMGSLMVGMAQHGGILPVGGTFLVFSDYMRPAIRLAALSQAKVIFSFTHDSVGVGEDGPTHQPIEHIASLRAIPGLKVLRPADATETAGAWQAALEGSGPTALILTRQNLEVLQNTSAEKTALGAYVVSSPAKEPMLQILASGSEVAVALDAAKLLVAEEIMAQVVSIPSFELFESQPDDYKTSILLDIPRLSIEAGVSFGWERWADETIGINRFGASAPGNIVMEALGIKPSTICEKATQLLNRN